VEPGPTKLPAEVPYVVVCRIMFGSIADLTNEGSKVLTFLPFSRVTLM